MKKLLKIVKETDNKYLNLYHAFYQYENGKVKEYEFASRRNQERLVLNNNERRADAVRILPYYKKGDIIFVVFIKEFRSPLNRYIYSLPAGMVDEGESSESAAIRETYEEIGGNVLKLEKVVECAYSSAGLTDENITSFNAEIELSGTQHLEESEDIKLKIVKLDDVLDFINNNEFCLPSALQSQAFYYKHINDKQKVK